MCDALNAAAVVALFEGADALGTQAGVVIGGTPVPVGYEKAQAQCRACWATGGLQVYCSRGDAPIVFCGHGLLATAYLWWQAGGALPLELRAADEIYWARLHDGQLWLECRRRSWRPESSLVAARWFQTPPLEAAVCGDETGYWILRWPDGFDLRRLEPDLEAICRDTRRAVITTALAPNGVGADVALRYFAPQYGSGEDAVTGSACVVLAGYWPGERLTLRQYSAEGGLVAVRKHRDTVAFSGSLRLLPAT